MATEINALERARQLYREGFASAAIDLLETAVEQGAEDKANRHIPGQERCDHADRDHGQTDKPIAQITGKHQSDVELAFGQDRKRDERCQLAE